ncbi:marine proteobacterial sortase target protein [Pseudoalteromonas denitrificans]|uniref:Ca-activated chloride channel family protein n=1 Tax=Pseudoalteromonas denitrificans DSM 6059 TaxID=1123010 RepID=A0A1I1L948_9GAMM|nr:marine proteobacterial sortase target protein [Pseudoalteromonas denitrificans]SFC69529.1 Ca-activated chloride channel family protein [Pseudoalteromonas denitrificans DSM 6059]
MMILAKVLGFTVNNCKTSLFLLTLFICQSGLAFEVEKPRLELKTLKGEEINSAILLTSHADMTITGLINQVDVTQTFKNTHESSVNARYVFPLPDESAVYQLEMKIGERVIKGEIKEKQMAKRIFQKAKKQGKKASLVTQKRANIFVTQVANIPAGEEITIKISYQQVLSYKNQEFSLRFPMVVAPRYQPKTMVFDEDLASGWIYQNNIKANTEITKTPLALAEPKNKMSLNIILNSGFVLANIKSPYHQIDVENLDIGKYKISLTENKTLANRDFVLRWKPEQGNEVQAALFSEKLSGISHGTQSEDNYALIMLMPPSNEFQAQQRLPRELVFVIDTSGSMHGNSMEQAKQALFLALADLNPEDSFNIIEFDSNVDALSEHAIPATDFNLRRAKQYVYNLQADGGTEIAKAFTRVLDSNIQTDFLRQVIFMTDGSISNEQQVFEQIKNTIGTSRLFTVGIGSAPNSYFMRRAADIGRGSFTFIGSSIDIKPQMQFLLKQLKNPSLKQLRIEGEASEVIDFWPKPIPDLYFSDPLMVALKLNKKQKKINILGQSIHGEFKAQLNITEPAIGDSISRIWARQKIKSLLLYKDTFDKKSIDTKQEVLNLALKHHLLSPYTAFVAVDSGPITTDDIVNKASKTQKIKGMRPAGWTMGSKKYVLPQTDGQSWLKILLGMLIVLLSVVYWRYQRYKRIN